MPQSKLWCVCVCVSKLRPNSEWRPVPSSGAYTAWNDDYDKSENARKRQ